MSLPPPKPVRLEPRRLFDPATGPFRQLERVISLALSRRVFPRLPGSDWPYGLQLERSLTVSEAQVEIASLPEAFQGAKVLLLTDLHAGPFVSPERFASAFDRLRGLAPDLVLLGGDLVTSRLAEAHTHFPALRSLGAPLGVFAVLGNHDHYTGDPERLVQLLAGSGVRVLDNSAVSLERGGARLALAGIDDLVEGRPALGAALEAAVQVAGESPLILLSHNPDVFVDAAFRGVELVLSGHTHGGQVRVPGLPILVRMSRYRLDEGRYRLGRSELVVSRGLGASGLPARVGCPPEAVLLTLAPGPAAPTEHALRDFRRGPRGQEIRIGVEARPTVDARS